MAGMVVMVPTLRAAVMDAQGQFTERQQVDALVCDCCQTAAVMTLDGPLVIYRDRTETERRDIASSRRLQGNWTVSQPVGVDGWQINGCPVNGPALVARENDVAALCGLVVLMGNRRYFSRGPQMGEKRSTVN